MPRHNNRDASVSDRISALPDDLIHRVMAFLTAREAVQTCVLSRRWQNVWASVRRLNVDAAKFTSLKRFKEFVDDLLLHRGSTPLDTLWLRITFDCDSIYFSDYSEIRPWVNHALRSNTQVLGIVDDGLAEALTIEGAFTSLHLKRLHLWNFEILDGFVEKLSSGCPALEDLVLRYCGISATTFSSTTLKRFTVTEPKVFPYGWPQHFESLVIDMPNLVSLCLDFISNRNPYIVDVSSLITASIHIDVDYNVLSALSKATNLQSLSLTADEDDALMVVSSNVLRCGSFSNLTNLSLGDWCLSTGCSVLLHLLRCSPKIEKLILNLTSRGASYYDHPEQRHAALETNFACNETGTPFCENLKKIKIKCPVGDKRVQAIVGILCTNITSSPEIKIKPSERLHILQD